MKQVVLLALVAFAAAAGVARSDVGVIAVSRTSASPGDVVSVRVPGYDRAWPRMPLYLVPAARVPKRVRGHRLFSVDELDSLVLHPPIQRFLGRWRPGDPVVYLGALWAP